MIRRPDSNLIRGNADKNITVKSEEWPRASARIAATCAIISLWLMLDPVTSLCNGVADSCGTGTATILDIGRVDVAFTLIVSQNDLVTVLGSPSEDMLQRMVCTTAREKFAVEFCYATYHSATRTLYGHLILADASRYIDEMDIVSGELKLDLEYRPIVRYLFPTLTVQWDERVVAFGRSVSATNTGTGGRVHAQLTVPIDTGLTISNVNHASQISHGLYTPIVVTTSGIEPTSCLVRVVRGEDMIFSTATVGCGPVYLVANQAWVPAADYELQALAITIDGENISADIRSSPLEITTVSTFVNLTLSIHRPSGTLVSGESFVAVLATEEASVTSTVSVLGPDLNEVDRHQADDFDRSEIGINTGDYALGDYLVLMQASHPVVGSTTVSRRFRIVTARAVEEEAPFTDKQEYTTEESIRVSFPGLNSECAAYVRDHVGTVYASSAPREPCSGFFLDIPDTVPSGVYTLDVEVYQGPALRGTRRTSVRIERIEHVDRLREVCRKGLLMLTKDTGVPCLDVGKICSPGPDDMPYCLCTNGPELPSRDHVCLPGATCTKDGCLEGSQVVVDTSGGMCTVRAGFLFLPCLHEGNICSKTSCSCLDTDESTVDVCYYGELCTHDGCGPPSLLARIRELDPDHERIGRLRQGTVIEVEAVLRYKDQPLTDGADASLIIRGTEYRARTREHEGSGVWRFGFFVRTELEPGDYKAYFRFSAQGEVWLSMRPFEVWNDATSFLVTPLGRLQMTLDHEDLMYGSTRRLLLTVEDDGGETVDDLPQSAFYATLDDVPLEVSGVSFEPSKDYWEVDVLLRNATPEHLGQGMGDYNLTKLTLSVSDLGREGSMEIPEVRIYVKERATLEIVSFEPRSYIYQIETSLGFDLDINLNMKRLTGNDLRNIKINIINRGGLLHGPDGDEMLPDQNVTFGWDDIALISTPAGVRATVRNIAFCNPPVFVQRSLVVNVSIPGVVSDEALLAVRGNPTYFLYPKGSETKGCEPLRAGETSYGAVVGEYRVGRDFAVVQVSTSKRSWPPDTRVVFELVRGHPEVPDVYNCILEPEETTKECVFTGLSIRPGTYAMAASIQTGDIVLRKVADKVVVT